MDPNAKDCDPVAVIQTLQEQARSLRQAATTMYAQADNLDAIAYDWQMALQDEGGESGGRDPGKEEPPAPGMRGGPRRR